MSVVGIFMEEKEDVGYINHHRTVITITKIIHNNI